MVSTETVVGGAMCTCQWWLDVLWSIFVFSYWIRNCV